MPEDCDIIAIFPIYSQFGAIQKADFRCIVCETYIFINSALLSWKKQKTELKNLWHSSHIIALSKCIILAKRRWFVKKNADIIKIKKSLVLKGIFSKTTYRSVMYQISIFCNWCFNKFSFTKSKMMCIVTYKHGIYELSYELPNDWRLRI